MNFIKSFIKEQSDALRDSLAEENIKKMNACFRAGFFFTLMTGTVICPLGVIFHAPSALIWIVAIIFGITLSGVLSSSPVFTRPQVYKVANYITIVSVISCLLVTGTLSIFHIHIKPL